MAVETPPNHHPAGALRRLIVLQLALLIGLVGVVRQTAPVVAQEAQRCFPEAAGIDNCVSGRFLEFWEQHGGVEVFGYPLTTAEFAQTDEGAFLTQYFERARFELHPENLPPYDVLLGRLGDERYTALNGSWQDEPGEDPIPACDFWEETQRNICGPFAELWRDNGLNIDGDPATSTAESLALWGLPITGQTPVVTADGVVIEQWFERARFEQQTDGSITIGRLGAEVLDNPSPIPEPSPVVPDFPVDAEPPTPAAPTAPNVPAPSLPCDSNVPPPSEGLQVWFAGTPEADSDIVACVRLIVNGEAAYGAYAITYRYINGERVPSLAHPLGSDATAGFIFYVGPELSGRTIPVEAVVVYNGQTYSTFVELKL